MTSQLAERFTEVHTGYGPWKRFGWREVVDTETGEITRESFAQHCVYGRWVDGLPSKQRKDKR